jgi:tetratricopeptide (TPR) repeat protein
VSRRRSKPAKSNGSPPPAAAHFADAIALHGQGRLGEAEAIYRNLLNLDPEHCDALHLLGVIALQTGHPQEASELMREALGVNPALVEAHSNLGLALQALGRLEEALDCFSQALRLKPDYAEAFYNQGLVLHQLNRPQEALASYAQALAINPAYAEAFNNQGLALNDLNQIEAALGCFAQAIRLNPQYIDAHCNHALALQLLKRPLQALASYDDLLRLHPEYAEALNNKGNILQQLRRWEEAAACYDRALQIKPGFTHARNNRGAALLALHRPEEALADFNQAVEAAPDYADAHNNQGLALTELGRSQEALESFSRALQLRPDYAEVFNNRANALQRLQRSSEALEDYGMALRIMPNYSDAHWNRCLCLLGMGDFERGLEEYEWRRQTHNLNPSQRVFTQPLWLGQVSLTGKTLLLHAEQGLGDTLQFCRYAKLLAEQGATVVMEVQAPLKALLAKIDGVAQVIAQGEVLPPFDYQCPLLSLPLAFGTRLQTIPAPPAYLQADPVRSGVWRERLSAFKRPRIGLVWSGNPEHPHDRHRSIPLAVLAGLASSGASFFSVQKDVRPSDRPVLEAHPHIIDYSAEFHDFVETAAFIDNLDGVIAVDTAVAHLAGALGKPVWVLVAYSADWRWLQGRADSPWYASVKLFRQPAPGDWESVISHVRAELEQQQSPSGPG